MGEETPEKAVAPETALAPKPYDLPPAGTSDKARLARCEAALHAIVNGNAGPTGPKGLARQALGL